MNLLSRGGILLTVVIFDFVGAALLLAWLHGNLPVKFGVPSDNAAVLDWIVAGAVWAYPTILLMSVLISAVMFFRRRLTGAVAVSAVPTGYYWPMLLILERATS